MKAHYYYYYYKYLRHSIWPRKTDFSLVTHIGLRVSRGRIPRWPFLWRWCNV